MSTEIDEIAVGFIGAGAMGSALAKAVSRVIPADHIYLADSSPEKTRQRAAKIGARAAESNADAARRCGVIFIGVKPYLVADVLTGIAPELKGKTLVSMAAGVSLTAIKDCLAETRTAPPAATVRIMPNTPVSVGEGIVALAADDRQNAAAELVKTLLSRAGRIEQVPESLIDCAGAVSGSGPAYGFIFIEALADAAVLLGMPRNQAYIYAAQTLKGAAALALESGAHPAALKDAVCSPGGTTIEAVSVLEERGFRAAIIHAVRAAHNKSAAVGKK
ncbi:pyrroline-5-carboxylate reductase [Treponema endosymbiont of Eucomonympha sp.]|uniref:pyrroline-5-carboxylate reductase n=1 Tax=Treponema endosymbiont of Eucomonympha sp. TaxID=1580831 RepID=UPI000784D04E|nr:pyrroline-5-carboxylate reductase [Treponema endosymbiont of Eucomonympha sp.]